MHAPGPAPTPAGDWLRRRGRAWPALLMLLAGCRLTGPDRRYDLLEAELRDRNADLAETRGEVERLRVLAATFQRQPPYVYGAASPTTTNAESRPVPGAGVRDVTLGGGTGGVDEDNRPGDESLVVVVAPRDEDGTVVKIPARVVVRAYEISRQGRKTPIGQWDVGPEQVRRTWKNGLFGSGYFLPLQWDTAPGTTRVRIAVQVIALDGQAFEADKDVTVRPLPNVPPHDPGGPALPEGPASTRPDELPYPRDAGLPPREAPAAPAARLGGVVPG